ncbi:hypothetical protein BOTBODRAFT_57144 [Botryobasidium botryosum FD-172 SS1]|uniref:Uncharacterized protein n=1 Tax=Botryobasidium botryosum (strain FD-172 SS1) TaxID=930990 RepID=A0A067M805_BOTB1|nr:hypothetical protein BOTBODRAFT_57144 [Botryobasidium botryosum FD-172 SS1]
MSNVELGLMISPSRGRPSPERWSRAGWRSGDSLPSTQESSVSLDSSGVLFTINRLEQLTAARAPYLCQWIAICVAQR